MLETFPPEVSNLKKGLVSLFFVLVSFINFILFIFVFFYVYCIETWCTMNAFRQQVSYIIR